jgi:hypothetical protein
VKRSSMRIWPLVGALVGALAATSVSGAGHDGTNIFHLGLTNSASGTTALQTNTTAASLSITNTNTGTAAGAISAITSGSTVSASAVTGSTVGSSTAAGVYGHVVPSENTSGIGVFGSNNGSGDGVRGSSTGGVGVEGTGATFGMHGFSASGTGVSGQSQTGTGIRGSHSSTSAGTGVWGSTGASLGIGYGVLGSLEGGLIAVDSAGVRGRITHDTEPDGYGVWGSHAGLGIGVRGTSPGGTGTYGLHSNGTGTAPGVHGRTVSSTDLAAGVYGEAPNGAVTAGVYGNSSALGVLGIGNVAGVLGYSPAGLAGLFSGNVHVTGTLTKGAGAFRIDHPLDPKRKYLQHSFVESPDMKNVYDGVVTTDHRGYATVRLPRYFQALNRDFRYQLTSLSGLQNVAIARKIRGNRFLVQSEKPRSEISWQVTGIRKDAYANAHRIHVEVTKSDAGRAIAALAPKLARRMK